MFYSFLKPRITQFEIPELKSKYVVFDKALQYLHLFSYWHPKQSFSPFLSSLNS